MTKQDEIVNTEGRPLLFPNKETLQRKINKYFKDCEDNEKPLTICGLAVALKTNRQTLLRYADKEEFSDTINAAKMMCEKFASEFLFAGKNVAGAIFNLKNNYGWKDKTEIEVKDRQYIIVNPPKERIIDVEAEEDEERK